jgi:hypothetical protein
MPDRFHSLFTVIGPFPAPRNRLLTKAEWADIAAARDPAETARKQERLDWVASQLLEATLRAVPRDVRRRWKGNLCIDATPIAAFGKRHRRPTSRAATHTPTRAAQPACSTAP